MIARELRAWMTGEVLPFWSTAGLDAATGLFHERLTAAGAPDPAAPRRVRVQARQIYTYAHAAAAGWYPQGAEIALAAFDALHAQWPRGATGGFVHALAPDGTVLAGQLDAYDQAFLVLAFAWLARASGETRVRAALDETIARIDAQLTRPDGSLAESVPPVLPRRQNPQMHWFESLLALKETLDHPRAAGAAALLALARDRLFDPASGTILEYFAEDWSRLPPPEGVRVEPGHLAEWVWLLARSDALFGTESAAWRARLLDSALRIAPAPDGPLVDETTSDGTILKPGRRSWLQTELAKAWLAEAAHGRPGAARTAAAALQRLADEHLMRPFRAGWQDALDAQGRPLDSFVSASLLYHIFVAVFEADRVLGRPE